MTNIIDRGSQPLSAYLNKILTVLIKKAGGELRISAIDMLEALDGEGFLRHYDSDAKELVLRLAPLGSELYFIKGGEVWADNRKVPISSAVPASGSPQDSYQGRRRIILDDEKLAQLEEDRYREQIARQAEEVLIDFPQAPQTVRDYQRPQQPSFNQQPKHPQQPGIREQFFRR